MKRFALILLIILILPITLFAQQVQTQSTGADSANLIIHKLETGTNQGKVKVVQDPRLTGILRKHFEYNKTSAEPGWRILIYKGRDMSKANQVKADFEQNFSKLNMRVNVEYYEPDFSTLVGAFKTKEDAFRYKQMLSARFPQAYLVPVRITKE
jgi:hypothetical protein